MKYVGPDYDDSYGIVLPGLSNTFFPRLMTDSKIFELLSIFPHLSPYFSDGNNGNSENSQNLPILTLGLLTNQAADIIVQLYTLNIEGNYTTVGVPLSVLSAYLNGSGGTIQTDFSSDFSTDFA